MIVLRYIDLLNKEFTTLQQSMAIRGIKWEGSVLDKIHGLRLIPVPMIFRLIGHINQQSLAVDNLGGTSTSKPFDNSQSNNKFEISKVSVTYDLSKDVPENDFVLKFSPKFLLVHRYSTNQLLHYLSLSTCPT